MWPGRSRVMILVGGWKGTAATPCAGRPPVAGRRRTPSLPGVRRDRRLAGRARAPQDALAAPAPSAQRGCARVLLVRHVSPPLRVCEAAQRFGHPVRRRRPRGRSSAEKGAGGAGWPGVPGGAQPSRLVPAVLLRGLSGSSPDLEAEGRSSSAQRNADSVLSWTPALRAGGRSRPAAQGFQACIPGTPSPQTRRCSAAAAPRGRPGGTTARAASPPSPPFSRGPAGLFPTEWKSNVPG